MYLGSYKVSPKKELRWSLWRIFKGSEKVNPKKELRWSLWFIWRILQGKSPKGTSTRQVPKRKLRWDLWVEAPELKKLKPAGRETLLSAGKLPLRPSTCEERLRSGFLLAPGVGEASFSRFSVVRVQVLGVLGLRV